MNSPEKYFQFDVFINGKNKPPGFSGGLFLMSDLKPVGDCCNHLPGSNRVDAIILMNIIVISIKQV